MPKRIRSVLTNLLEPVTQVQDLNLRRQSRLLAGLLLIFIFFAAIMPTVLDIIEAQAQSNRPVEPPPPHAFLASVMLLIAYGFNRYGRHRLAVVICVIGGSGAIIASAFLTPPESAARTMYYLVLVVYFSSLFLTPRHTVVVVIIHSIILFSLPHIVPGLRFQGHITNTLTHYLVMTFLMVAINTYKGRIEEQQQHVLALSEERYRLIAYNADEGIIRTDKDGRILYINPRMTEILGFTSEDMIGRAYFEFLNPAIVPQAKILFERYKQGHKDRQDIRFYHKDRSVVWTMTAATPIFDDKGHFDGVLTLMTDITARKQAQAAEHEQRLLAEKYNEISALLTASLNLNEVLDRLLETIRWVIPCDGMGVLLIEDDLARIVRYHDQINPTTGNIMIGKTFNIAEIDDLKRMIEKGETVIIPVVSEYRSWRGIPGQEWIQSSMTFPICLGTTVIGAFSLGSQQRDYFQEAHLPRLKTFANYAAIAIRNAQLYAESQELAVTQERQRLARELHDAVNQTLFSASVIAGSLPRLWDKDPEAVREGVGDLERLTKGALAGMRTSLFEMRPEALVESELGVLLSYLVDSILGKKRDVNVILNREGDGKLLPDVQIALYRIAQEALNNAVKYAHAGEIRIDLKYQISGVELSIVDNGRGFEKTVNRAVQFGLRNMRERADSIGAIIEIKTRLGEGTTVRVTCGKDAFATQELPVISGLISG